MAELGLNQTELAARCGIPRLTINRLVTKKTALPDAETRRKLAKGMGVSHLDILVAAGELEPDEVEAAGVQGVVEERPMPDEVAEALKGFDWDAETSGDVASVLRVIAKRRNMFPRQDYGPSTYERKRRDQE